MAPSIRRERTEFQPYARALADLVGLKDWRVEIVDEPPDSDDAFAFVECLYGQKYALIRLSDNCLKASEEDQRHAIVHELCHAHHTAVDQVVAAMVGDRQYELYRLQVEYSVDAVAVALAALLPLPSEVLDARKPKRRG